MFQSNNNREKALCAFFFYEKFDEFKMKYPNLYLSLTTHGNRAS